MTINQKEGNLVNIWQIHFCFICPLAGLCFSDFEIKEILKSPGSPNNLKVSTMDFHWLHQALMAKLMDRNDISEKADRLLRAKYAEELGRFGAMDEAEFQKVWTNGLSSRIMPAMLYVAAIRRDLSADFLGKVYGDVHMMGYRAMEERLATQAMEMRRLERERRKAEIKMFEALATNGQLERELNHLIAGFAQLQSSPRCTRETCSGFDTCSRRILIVGGLTKLKEMYRKIVESNGGIFDYHSGRIRNCNSNLEARVKMSDLVICPVSHNSHNACLKVKQFCSKHNKDIHMISGSSLADISTVFAVSGLEGNHEPLLN